LSGLALVECTFARLAAALATTNEEPVEINTTI
jgi:hypothetical protein